MLFFETENDHNIIDHMWDRVGRSIATAHWECICTVSKNDSSRRSVPQLYICELTLANALADQVELECTYRKRYRIQVWRNMIR